MEFKDATTQLFERSNALEAFWVHYITIALALIAFFGASQRSSLLAAILTLAFIGSAIVNLGVMMDVARQRLMLYELIAASKDPNKAPLDKVPPAELIDRYLSASHPAKVEAIIAAHIFCDLIVVSAIWTLTALSVPGQGMSGIIVR